MPTRADKQSVGETKDLESTLRDALVENPHDIIALERLGKLAFEKRDYSSATEYYGEAIQSAIDLKQTPSLSLLNPLIEIDVLSGRPFEAIETIQQAIEFHPSNAQLRFDLVGLATMVGLPNEALPTLRWLAQRGQGDADSWLVLADPARVQPDAAMCEKWLAQAGPNGKPNYGLAKIDAENDQWRSVAERLKPVIEAHPDFLPAQSLYGLALFELGELEQLEVWQKNIPSSVRSTPDYFLVAGLWAQHQGKHEQAARAFWEVLKENEAGYAHVLGKLSLSLAALNRSDDLESVSLAITRYSTLRDSMKTFLERSSQSQRDAFHVATALMELGRIWEAEGWARLAVSLPQDRVQEIREVYLSIRSQLAVDTPWQLPEKSIASRLDLRSLATVDWVNDTRVATIKEAWQISEIRFIDQARDRNFIHTCETEPKRVEDGHWIYHTLGGGVSVIDFDLDGWPDLASSMLDGKPMQMNSSPNRLFRNLEGTFVEVGVSSHYLDQGYSQGIAVGDFNNDGFPDLYDANIGTNRMYRNNGDGTFSEVTLDVGLTSEEWTTSVAIADLDGDGIADLYDANYCGGPRPFTERCVSGGHTGTCAPLKFPAELDRVWRGRGDGGFMDVTNDWMDQATPGRGLAISIGAFDERAGLDVYVANDMTSNHLWSARLGTDSMRLDDVGVVRGLGQSGRSVSQASMGIAAGDPDRDGDIDFFVTHFSNDHNTYYEQVASGRWSDRTFAVGLLEPSMKLLAFGTQWCDFDNNASIELIVANGHIDQTSDPEIAFEMPTQVFQRNPSGRWLETPATMLGDYFEHNHVGRSVALLDVDRDRRMDVAITHLYEPVSLLVNDTKVIGNSLGLILKATSGHRDAIGAKITVRVSEQDIVSQLSTGDGYMASNERRVVFGLGASKKADDVSVTWPSGKTESFGSLQVMHDYLLVEGNPSAFQYGDVLQ